MENEKETAEAILKSHMKGIHMVNGRYFYTWNHPDALKQLTDWPMRDDDILISSFARSGTHLIKNILSHVMHDGNPPDMSIFSRVHYIDVSDEVLLGKVGALDHGRNPLKTIDKLDQTSPRLLCTHLPYSLVPNDAKNGRVKVIVNIRNPKDVITSFHHAMVGSPLLTDSSYSPGEWLDQHTINRQCFPQGDWFEHVQGWYEKKNEIPHILFVKYEDIIQDPEGEISRVADFVGKNLSKEVIADIAQKCCFKTQKTKEDLFSDMNILESTYLRKGVIGDWKNFFTVAMNERFEEFYNTEIKDIDITFDYEPKRP